MSWRPSKVVCSGRAAKDVFKDLIANVALLRRASWISGRRVLGGARARPSWCHGGCDVNARWAALDEGRVFGSAQPWAAGSRLVRDVSAAANAEDDDLQLDVAKWEEGVNDCGG